MKINTILLHMKFQLYTTAFYLKQSRVQYNPNQNPYGIIMEPHTLIQNKYMHNVQLLSNT